MRTNLYLYQPQAEEWITNPDEYKKEDVLLSIQNIYQDEIYLTYYDSKAEIRKVWEKGFDLEDEAQFVGMKIGLKFMITMERLCRKLICIRMMMWIS